jgi:adenine-specific DNA-methyltransferase
VRTTPTVASPLPCPDSAVPARNEAGDPDPKLTGAYYTPPRLAGLLAGWVLERDPQRILEPSFGQGVFLREIAAKLHERGIHEPGRRIFGVELDRSAASRLRESGLRLPERHLHSGDLLSFDADALGGPFDAIVGNPPYIRHHLLDEALVARGRRSASRLGITLNGRSDAWAYFCAHLMTFLSGDGRLALVLPGSVLQADYAKPLLNALAAERGEVQLIRIGERLFAGVQERTVLLLIDRARPGDGHVINRRTADLSGLARALSRQRKVSVKTARRRRASRLPPGLNRAEAELFETICGEEKVQRLDEVARVRIGVVTGANSFFIRSEREAEALGVAVDSAPIVSRGAWLAEPRWTKTAQHRVAEEPSRLLLFPVRETKLTQFAEAALRAAEEEDLNLRSHCSRRKPWFAISDRAVPDLFLPYMASQPPRLVMNDANATCTNTIHRLWLKTETELEKEAIAAASWTTLYRLSAELVGRSYGGGVLKLEPTRAGGLRLATTSKEPKEVLQEIADEFSSAGPDAARMIADRRLLREGLGLSREDVGRLRAAANSLEALRRR